MKKDYYKILEVSQFSKITDIKKSYRKLAMKYHPDKNPGDITAESKFKEIAEAYQVLSNSELKKKYDAEYNNSQFGKTESSTSQNTDSNNYQSRTSQLSPEEYLQQIISLRKQVISIGKNRINHFSLFNSLNEFLSTNSINTLIRLDNRLINRQIIDEICTCCNYLEFYETKKIISKLIQIAGTDNDALLKIHSFTKRRKMYDKIERNIGGYAVLAVLLIIIIVVIFNSNSISEYNDSSKVISTRPQSGEVFADNNKSISIDWNNKKPETNYSLKPLKIQPIKPSNSLPVEDYSSWNKPDLKNGTSPDCYNYTPVFDYSLDNSLEVKVGANTDVVIKLIDAKTNRCIRYVYIRQGTTFAIVNIPEGKYYTKIAYGSDWRQKIINEKCIGKFLTNVLYKKGEEILDFYKVYKGKVIEGDREYTNYEIPSYSLFLDVKYSDYNTENYNTNTISESEFNQ